MEDSKAPVEQPENASGVDGEDQGSTETPEAKKPDVVKFETHSKLLGEKKRVQAERDELRQKVEAFERAKAEAEQRDLEAKGEYDKILKQYKDEIGTLSTKLSEREKRDKDLMKYQAFLGTLGGSLKSNDYTIHIDFDSIAIDPDSGEVDEMSVAKEVERFRKTHPDLIKSTGAGPKTPATAPGGNSEPVKLTRKDKALKIGELVCGS